MHLPSKNQYVPSLDGWRALAVGGVVIGHLAQSSLSDGGAVLWWQHYAIGLARYGVDIFFGLSGFLICSRLIQEKNFTGTISLKNFYIRRCFRILPAFFSFLMALGFLNAAGVIDVYKNEILSCIFFFRNYYTGPATWFTAHVWSLSVEEHFYLFIPALLLLPLRRVLFISLLVCFLVFLWRILDENQHIFAQYFSRADILYRTDTRLDSLLWGCVVALLVNQKFFSKIRLTHHFLPFFMLAVFACVMLVHFPYHHFFRIVMIPVTIATTSLFPESLPTRFLEIALLRWLGRLSYSIYLWQQLFIAAEPTASFCHFLQVFPVNVAALIAVAWLSYRFIEQPMIAIGRNFIKKRGQEYYC